MNPVAIIGGGITGLTAGLRLKQLGLPFKLYEAGERVGGAVQSVRERGHLAEAGPNSILETSPVVSALVSDLGLESRRIYADPRAAKRYIVRNGKPVALPASPRAFLSTPLFSAKAKSRLLAEPFIGRAAPDTEENLADFVRRRLGVEFLDYAINPFVGGVYAGDPEALSVKHAFPKLHALEQRYGSLLLGQVLGARERKRRGEVSKQAAKMFSFDEGLGVLIKALQKELAADLETESPVRRLMRQPDVWSIAVGDGAGEKEVFCQSVLLALPAHKLAALEVRAGHPIDMSEFSRIYYPPVASVVLGFRREDVKHPLDGFGVLVPEKEGFNILGALFSSSLFPNRAPAGEVTITCFLGGTRSPWLPPVAPDTLVQLAVKDLDVLLDLKGEPTFSHVTVFKKAIPQYNVGFGHFKALMNSLEIGAPGLFLAGHSRDGISLSDSIISGHNVAQRIQTFLGSGKKGATLRLQHAA
jgi:oxygen-dependent protoporphyrinogen oxidase